MMIVKKLENPALWISALQWVNHIFGRNADLSKARQGKYGTKCI